MFWDMLVPHRVELNIMNIMLFNHHSKTPNPRESLQEMKVIFLILFRRINLLLTVPKAAEELSISRSSMYRLISEGRIPTVNLVGKIRIKETSLKSFIDQLERESRLERINK
jgi:excisionase family DNA binding protein